MPSDLVELARFPSSAEASIVRGQLDAEGIRAELGGEAMASWFWHLGSAIGGVRLLVSEDDVDRALEILGSSTPIDETEDIDFGDDSTDDASDDDGAKLPEDLIRAWRASLIGFFLLPPLLNIYSMLLLSRHGFFIGRRRNWRVLATCFANVVVFAIVVLIIFAIFPPTEPFPEFIILDGEPVKTETEYHSIPIVPPISP